MRRPFKEARRDPARQVTPQCDTTRHDATRCDTTRHGAAYRSVVCTVLYVHLKQGKVSADNCRQVSCWLRAGGCIVFDWRPRCFRTSAGSLRNHVQETDRGFVHVLNCFQWATASRLSPSYREQSSRSALVCEVSVPTGTSATILRKGTEVQRKSGRLIQKSTLSGSRLASCLRIPSYLQILLIIANRNANKDLVSRLRCCAHHPSSHQLTM